MREDDVLTMRNRKYKGMAYVGHDGGANSAV